MYQVEFATRRDNRGYLQFLMAYFKKNFNKLDILLHYYEDDKFSYILLAGLKNYYCYFDEIVKIGLNELMQRTIKYDYFFSKISIDDKFLKIATATMLQNFDTVWDLKEIKNITFSERFFIDSFFEFRLKKFYNHWEKMLHISVGDLTLNDSLKMMLTVSDRLEDRINIISNENYLKIYKIDNLKSELIFSGDEFSAFSEIIRVNAKKIKFYIKNDAKSSILRHIIDLMGERVKVEYI